MSEPEQESKPTPHRMTKEEFDLLTFQGISPITGERMQSASEIAKQKERQSKHEFRVFLVFWRSCWAHSRFCYCTTCEHGRRRILLLLGCMHID